MSVKNGKRNSKLTRSGVFPNSHTHAHARACSGELKSVRRRRIKYMYMERKFFQTMSQE